MNTRHISIMIFALAVSFCSVDPCHGLEFRVGLGPSIHGRDLGADINPGFNLLLETGTMTEFNHFMCVHAAYNSHYRDEKKSYHMAEIGLNAILNASRRVSNPYAILGLGYAITNEGSDNGVYVSAGLGLKHILPWGDIFFIQATANIGFNDKKDSFGNDPGYLYIPITFGYHFNSP